MNNFANKVVNLLTFNQWLHVEYQIVKKQFKELDDSQREILRKRYEAYCNKGGF